MNTPPRRALRAYSSLLERYRAIYAGHGHGEKLTDPLYYQAICGSLYAWRALSPNGRRELATALLHSHRPDPLLPPEDEPYAERLFSIAYSLAFHTALLVRDPRLVYLGPRTMQAPHVEENVVIEKQQPGHVLTPEPRFLVREIKPEHVYSFLHPAMLQQVTPYETPLWQGDYCQKAQVGCLLHVAPDIEVTLHAYGFTCSRCTCFYQDDPLIGWCRHICAVWAMAAGLRMPRHLYASEDYHLVHFDESIGCYVFDGELTTPFFAP